MKNKQGISLIVLVITIIVMLILASATIISLANNGIIGKAKRAADKMDKAQIAQMAELIKGEYLIETKTNKNMAKSIQEFRQRLIESFEVTEDTNNDNIIEINDKWAVVIKNTDLDIEIVEITDKLKASSIVGMSYTTSNIVEDDVIYVTNVDISIEKLIERDKYVNIMVDDALSKVTQQEKEKLFYEFFNSSYGPEEPFDNIDDIVIYIINNDWYYTEYTTIDECLADENVQAEWGTTKEQLYYSLYIYYIADLEDEDSAITQEQAINAYYIQDQEGQYGSKYFLNTNNLKLYVKRPGKTEELLKDKIAIADNLVITDQITKNGTYEYILKTNKDEEITSERIKITGIATEGKYILTEEEAEVVWTVDEYNNMKYIGTKENVIIPIRIGEKVITTIDYRAFYNAKIKTVEIPSSIKRIGNEAFRGSTIESIVIPETIEEIGVYYTFAFCTQLKEITLKNDRIETWMFAGCTALETITIPANVTSIGQEAFAGCTNLKSIIFEGNITSYGLGVFKNCTGLKSIVIPEGNTNIGHDNMFVGCSNLEEVTLPNSIVNNYGAGNSTFSGCTNLTKIYFAPGNNPIPEGAPWGAPNPEVKVIKLQ